MRQFKDREELVNALPKDIGMIYDDDITEIWVFYQGKMSAKDFDDLSPFVKQIVRKLEGWQVQSLPSARK